jgi:hypothetical protein
LFHFYNNTSVSKIYPSIYLLNPPFPSVHSSVFSNDQTVLHDDLLPLFATALQQYDHWDPLHNRTRMRLVAVEGWAPGEMEQLYDLLSIEVKQKTKKNKTTGRSGLKVVAWFV